MEATNPQVFRTTPSKDVEITLVVNVGKDCSDAVLLENAAEALWFYAQGMRKKELPRWKSWAIKINTKILKVRT